MLNRISAILITGKPKYLYDEVLTTLYFGDNDGNFIEPYRDPYESVREQNNLLTRISRIKESINLPSNKGREHDSDDKLKELETELKNLKFDDLRIRNDLIALRYQIWMRYPEEKLRNMDKVSLRQTFPFCAIRIFNKEPVSIRNKIGDYTFEGIIKLRTKGKCQHSVSSMKQVYCRDCIPNIRSGEKSGIGKLGTSETNILGPRLMNNLGIVRSKGLEYLRTVNKRRITPDTLLQGIQSIVDNGLTEWDSDIITKKADNQLKNDLSEIRKFTSSKWLGNNDTTSSISSLNESKDNHF